MARSPAWTRKAGQNPKGGLNAKGRASYKAQTGGTLKAPVKKSAKTPEEKRRKGSFLVRMGSAAGPLMKDGKKTRLKLSLEAWGHFGDKASAVAKGRRILAAYKNMKIKKKKKRMA
tara:strand:- start:13376 stop:13723 length:348 start_codon:yes stop_codon:yes gene_type:complete